MSLPASFLPSAGEPGLVSVVISTYNRADLIGEAIESGLAQSYDNIELIVIDDGSRDQTGTVVAGFKDPRMRYFHQENGGLSSARNLGLKHAKGEFIAFLDSDDIWQRWKLSAQLEIFRRNPEVGMTWSDMSTFRKTGTILQSRYLRTYYTAYRRIRIEDILSRRGSLGELCGDVPADLRDCPYYVGNISEQMFLGNLVHPPTAVVRRERLQRSGPFEPEVTGNGGEDYHFYYRVCEHGPVALLDAPTIHYRIHSSQLSTAFSIHEARADIKVVTHWLSRRPPRLPKSVINRRVAAAYAWSGYEELHAGNRRAAMKHLWRSLVLNPTRLQTAVLLAVSMLPRSAIPLMRAAKRATRRILPVLTRAPAEPSRP